MGFFRLLPLLCLTGLVQASESPQPNVQQALQLVGIGLMCEQAAPLLAQDLKSTHLPALSKSFAAEPLCAQIADQVQADLPAETITQAAVLLNSPMAQHFTQLERAVGAETNGGFAAYRQKLAEKPPIGSRLELVHRLDVAAHASQLAVLLRYEVGKTQAWVSILDAGQKPDEKTLSEQTQAQAKQLNEGITKVVEVYMLYAYRQTPSDQLLATPNCMSSRRSRRCLRPAKRPLLKSLPNVGHS